MDTSKRSHEAPMTFNVVSWKGVLMPEVKEPIRVLRLTATRKRKVSSQISFAPNDKLVRAGMNNHGFQTVDMSGNAVSILCFSIYFSTCLLDGLFKQRLKPKIFLFLLEIRIWMVICTMDLYSNSLPRSNEYKTFIM